MQVATTLYSRGYRLGPRIGKGSYAKVKIAERVADSRILAAKIICRRRAPKEFLDKFMPRELSVILSLSHPNVAKIYEIIHTNEIVCIIMEFAERGDLLDYIKRRGALNERLAGKLFAQVCQGVDYLHSRWICHRDLKCENILLRRDMTATLSDFGFSRTIHDQRFLSSTYCGSAAYASPELLRGKPYKPLQSDIWSLGCILFIMVTGQMPFYDKNTKKMMYRQLKGKVNFPENRNISLGCKHLITSTLEPNSDLRYNIKDILSHSWVQLYIDVTRVSAVSCSAAQTEVPQQDLEPGPIAVSERLNLKEKVEYMQKTSASGSSLCGDSEQLDKQKPPAERVVDLSAECESNALDEKLSSTSVESEFDQNQILTLVKNSLCRMPGRACITHVNAKAELDSKSIDDDTSSKISNVSVVQQGTSDSLIVIETNPFGKCQMSSSVDDREYVVRKTHGPSAGSVKGNSKKMSEKSNDEQFKMTIKKILQIPITRTRTGIEQQSTGSSMRSLNGTSISLPTSQESSDTEDIDVAQSGSSVHDRIAPSQKSLNVTMAANTDVATKKFKQDISSEQNRRYQEGLVTQMRRIFESKEASTTTSNRSK